MNSIAVFFLRVRAFLLLALLILVGCDRPSKVSTTNRVPGQPGVVSALGRVEPFNGIHQIGGAPGDRVEKWHFDEGDFVKKGQKLVDLESQQFRRLDLELAEIQLRIAEEQLNAVKTSGGAQLQEATLKLARTDDGLKRDVEALDLKGQLLKDQYDAASADQKRLHELAPGSVSDQDIKRQDLVAESAKVDLESWRLARDRAMHAQRSAAEEGVAQLRALNASIQRSRLEVPTQSAKVNLKLAEQRYRASLIEAPISGIILAILTQTGEATGSRPLLRMADTSKLFVLAEVDENDVLLVKGGMDAYITRSVLNHLNIRFKKTYLPVTGDVPYPHIPGKVDSIAGMVGRNTVQELNPATMSDRRVVDVKILLDFDQIEDGEKVRQRLAKLINLQVNVYIVLHDDTSK